jgi:hypothetical protein
MMDLESGGPKCLRSADRNAGRLRTTMLGRSEVVVVTNPGSNRVDTDSLPAVTDPPAQHIASAATVPPLHGGAFSRAAEEYAGGTAHRFEQSVAVEQARWSRLAVIAGLVIGIVGNVAVALTQVLPSNPKTAIMLGVILVVLLGAGGLAGRGIGELRNSPGWKASGCFLCAAAYLGTATVALVNGLPLVFQP